MNTTSNYRQPAWKSGATSSDRWARWLCLLPLSLALLMIATRWSVPGISYDAVTYLQIARNILSGDGLGWQALWACPLLSVLVAGVALTGCSLQVAAGIVSSAAYLVCTVVVYFLGVRIEGIRTGLAASLLTALSPHLLFIACSAEPESLFTCLLALALLLFLTALERESVPLALAAGLFFGAAYLSRSEGFLVMAMVVAATTILRRGELRGLRKAAVPAATVLVFCVVAAPYLLFLGKHYGKLVVSPKSSYVMIWMKSRVYHDNDKGEIGNDELWGLSPDGTRLRWMEPKGMGDLVSYLRSHPAKSARVYLHNLSREIPGRIPNNSGMERYPQVFPVIVALLAIAGGIVSWNGTSREAKAVVLSPLLILLVLPVFTEGWWKYLVPYQPLVLLTGAVGSVRLLGALSGRFAMGRWGKDALLAVLVSTQALFYVVPSGSGSVSTYGAPAGGAVSGRLAEADEQMRAGEWAVARFGRGRNYMVQWSKLIYWLEGKWTAFPVASPREVFEYGRRQGAEFIVLEFAKNEPWEYIARPFTGVELVGAYASGKTPYVAAFYRFQ